MRLRCEEQDIPVLRRGLGTTSSPLQVFTFPSRSCHAGEFQDFSVHHPLHGKLFGTYLRPSQTPNASSPDSVPALANGAVQAPKQKGD